MSERDIVVECRGHDAAKICNVDHANGWQEDVMGMLEVKHRKCKVSISFECEMLKADEAAEDHIKKFMPKLAGMDAVVLFKPWGKDSCQRSREEESASQNEEDTRSSAVPRA